MFTEASQTETTNETFVGQVLDTASETQMEGLKTFWFKYGYNMNGCEWECGSHPIRAKTYEEALDKLQQHPVYTSQTAINDKNWDRFGEDSPFQLRYISSREGRMFYLSSDCNGQQVEHMNDEGSILCTIIKP